MIRQVKIKELPEDVQLQLISAVDYYIDNSVYLEHSYGKIKVSAISCIYAGKHPEDEWFSQQFKKSDFAFDEELKNQLVDDWYQLCKKYDARPYLEKHDMFMANEIVDLRNKINTEQLNTYYRIVLKRTLEREE